MLRPYSGQPFTKLTGDLKSIDKPTCSKHRRVQPSENPISGEVVLASVPLYSLTRRVVNACSNANLMGTHVIVVLQDNKSGSHLGGQSIGRRQS